MAGCECLSLVSCEFCFINNVVICYLFVVRCFAWYLGVIWFTCWGLLLLRWWLVCVLALLPVFVGVVELCWVGCLFTVYLFIWLLVACLIRLFALLVCLVLLLKCCFVGGLLCGFVSGLWFCLLCLVC